jgi:hypothetical protein
MFYVSLSDTQRFTEEWVTDRILSLIESDNFVDAKALANEHGIEWIDF